MKFKHTFHVLVDNFSVIYKQLLYRLIVFVIFGILGYVCVYQIMKELITSTELLELTGGVKDFVSNFLKGEVERLLDISNEIKEAYEHLISLLQTEAWRFVLSGIIVIVFTIIEKWFSGLGNYAAAILVNDKMALRASSPFLGSLISNLKEAAVYNAIYAPLSVLYDVIVSVLVLIFIYFLVAHAIMPLLIGIFTFTLVVVVATAFKLTFTSDWLPALIRGKLGQKQAIKYTFSQRGKNTLNVFSNFIVLVLIIMSVNVLLGLSTLGVGLLITIPGSFLTLVCFETVNYYDREELKYFLDKNTIVKPKKEQVITREQFFRGDDN